MAEQQGGEERRRRPDRAGSRSGSSPSRPYRSSDKRPQRRGDGLTERDDRPACRDDSANRRDDREDRREWKPARAEGQRNEVRRGGPRRGGDRRRDERTFEDRQGGKQRGRDPRGDDRRRYGGQVDSAPPGERGYNRSGNRDGRPGLSGVTDGRDSARRPLPRGDSRPPQQDRPRDPDIDESVSWEQLDREARGRLRTLSKDNAERVGAHLVMAGSLMDTDPEMAYLHAHAASRRAGRVDVVREAVALTAYATQRYAEALREARTVRRLSGVDGMRAIEADCERGLGRPERALALAAAPPSPVMSVEDRIELAIVASGARLDLAQPDAAMLILDQPFLAQASGEVAARVALARAEVLRALGRESEAESLDAVWTQPEIDDDRVEFGEVSAPRDGEPR